MSSLMLDVELIRDENGMLVGARRQAEPTVREAYERGERDAQRKWQAFVTEVEQHFFVTGRDQRRLLDAVQQERVRLLDEARQAVREAAEQAARDAWRAGVAYGFKLREQYPADKHATISFPEDD
jgi:hypothetical protein